MGCGFESEQNIPVPQSESKMVVFADLPISESVSSVVFVTRTRSIGENIQWDFNVGDSAKITDSTYFINKGFPLFDFVKGAKVQLFDKETLVREFKPSFEGEKSIGFLVNRMYRIKQIQNIRFA
ncbi:MAG: hypothetical protein HC817_13210 [Saprospiraceae bacterium]|nr:hypothetical protein [Saprospiraceae bacterium]